jgi:hypothetical protein
MSSGRMIWSPPLSGNTAVLEGNPCSRNCITSWTSRYQRGRADSARRRRRSLRRVQQRIGGGDKVECNRLSRAQKPWDYSRKAGSSVAPRTWVTGPLHLAALRRRQLLPAESLGLAVRQPDLSAMVQTHEHDLLADSPYPANITLRLVHYNVQSRSLADFRSSESVYYLLERREAR